MAPQLTEQLTDLLIKTGAAHGVYEETELNGVYDDAWSGWYATWALAHGMNDLLGINMDVAVLAPLLMEINDAHKQSRSGENWAQFTARLLVEKYRG